MDMDEIIKTLVTTRDPQLRDQLLSQLSLEQIIQVLAFFGRGE
jgi:hypothetical protein